MTLRERLDRESIPEPNSGCLLWFGYADRSGYGRVQWKGRAQLAHRLSYECEHGPIQQGLHLLHKCDVRACINPDHLRPGTQADNVADMIAKGREARGPRPRHRGEGNPNNRITEDVVRRVLLSDLAQPAAAKTFGISRAWVQRIRAREVWTHVDVPLSQIARPARKLAVVGQ